MWEWFNEIMYDLGFRHEPTDEEIEEMLSGDDLDPDDFDKYEEWD